MGALPVKNQHWHDALASMRRITCARTLSEFEKKKIGLLKDDKELWDSLFLKSGLKKPG